MTKTRPQSSAPTARRVVGRPFRKGQSGNPGGQPKGLVRAIREQTGEGDELVSFMLALFRGSLKGTRLRDRMDAATWLADRAFGRPVQQMEHPGRDGQPLISLAMLQTVLVDDGCDDNAIPVE